MRVPCFTYEKRGSRNRLRRFSQNDYSARQESAVAGFDCNARSTADKVYRTFLALSGQYGMRLAFRQFASVLVVTPKCRANSFDVIGRSTKCVAVFINCREFYRKRLPCVPREFRLLSRALMVCVSLASAPPVLSALPLSHRQFLQSS
jgi:hypothetical protein